MGLLMKDEGGSFTPCPAGNHVAVCYAVIDLGTQHNEAGSHNGQSWPASDRHQILFMWEIPGEQVEIDGEQKPAVISKFYTASFYEKAALRQHLEAWRGREFSQQELAGFDISNVLGKPCMLNVVHTEKGKAKIASVAAMPKGMTAPALTNETIRFDLDDYDQAVFNKISEGIQNIIKKSPEWQALQAPKANGFRQDPETTYADFEDDLDIPF